jgi:hypothetical protein
MQIKILLLLASLSLSLPALGQVTAGFNRGNLCVLRVGDNASALASSGDPVFLDEYTTNGILANSVAIPISGSDALIIGSATSEGAISRSPDKRFIVMVGYNTSFPYTSSLSGAAAATVPRGLATIDYNGSFNFITNTYSFFSGNNIRSGVTDGTNNFWAAGANSGTVYLGLASSATTVQSSLANSEVINIFNGNLCFSEQKTTPYGVYAFTGAPVTTNGGATLLFATGSGSSPFAFAISPDNRTAYVADDRAIASGGGIQKYTNNGAWSLLYTLGTGVGSTNGARGVVVSFGQPSFVYATTAESTGNRLITLADTGSASAATVLATAGNKEVFHGVQFTPEGIGPSITSPLPNQTVDVGQNALFSVMASGSATLYYLWESNSVALTGWGTNPNFTLATENYSTGSFSMEVLVSNSWGVTSSQATLTINPTNVPTPGPAIISEPQSMLVNAGGRAAFSVTASGSSLSYQWRLNGVNLTDGPSVFGSTSPELTLSNVFGASAGGYTVIVTNIGGAITSTPPAVLTVVDPYLSSQPAGGLTFLTGANTTLAVTAVGTGLSYQWTLNGAPVSGATNSSLTLTNLSPADSGGYQMLVSGAFGVVTSATATVTVAAPQTTFFPSNLIVLRVGDGAQTLINSGNTLFLDQWTPEGAYVSTMSLPDSGASALLISGVASSEGFMTLSGNGGLLAIAGYNTNRGELTSSLSSSSSAAVPRAIGTIDALGAYTLAVSTCTQYSKDNLRSGATDGYGNFWGAGSAGGIYYFGVNAAATNIENSITNCRVVNVINGALLFSTENGINNGLYSLGASPTNATVTNLLFSTANPSAPEDFAINPAGNLAYVSDDSGNGGVQRWQLTGGVWTYAYTMGSGSVGIGTRSLAVNFNPANPVIYAVTAETATNRLISIVDTGSLSTATTLAFCPVNELFRAVKFAPELIVFPQPALSGVGLSNGGISFNVAGVTGYRYAIEASSDLVNWVALQTNSAPFTFTRANTSGLPQQFYRAVYRR